MPPPGSPQTEALPSQGFQLEGRKRFHGNPLEKPEEKPAETWAAGTGEFLQKVTVFYIPSLCSRPARVSMKDPYSSPPGTTQTATAVVEGSPRGPGEKEARFPDFPFPDGFLMFVQGLQPGASSICRIYQEMGCLPRKSWEKPQDRSAQCPPWPQP